MNHYKINEYSSFTINRVTYSSTELQKTLQDSIENGDEYSEKEISDLYDTIYLLQRGELKQE